MDLELITVICLVPRVGPGVVLSKGDEWEVPPMKAARLIAAGQVKLLNKADADKLPKIEPPAPVAPAAKAEETEDDGDEFDESDAVNATADDGQTGLAKAKAKRKSKAEKEAEAAAAAATAK